MRLNIKMLIQKWLHSYSINSMDGKHSYIVSYVLFIFSVGILLVGFKKDRFIEEYSDMKNVSITEGFPKFRNVLIKMVF